MTARLVLAAASTAVLVFFAASAPLALTASAIDGGAKNKFDQGVDKVGGTEASGLPETIKNVINILLFVAGVAAVIIIVVGGLRFVTSEGDANSANKAKNAVVYACVGLVLATLAYAMVNFVLYGLGQ